MRVTTTQKGSAAGAPGAAGAVRRRRVLAGGGAVGTAAVLAACGAGSQQDRADAGSGAPATAAGPARLQLWFTLPGAQAEHVTRMNERFTGEHPGIEVELAIVPDAELPEKLAVAVAAGTPPDLATLGGATRVAELIAARRVVSLSRYRRDLARLDWYDALKAIAVRGDELYALPVLASPLALYYNADLYARAGLDPATPPATWDALLANAQALARLTPPVWGHAVGTKPIAWTAEQLWIAYLWQAGGEWLTPDGTRAAFNGPGGVDALQFWADLVQKYQVAPAKPVDNLVLGADFEAGAVGHMTIYSVWAIRAEGMRFPVRTAPLPRHARAATVAAGVSIPLFAESRQRDAGWAYLDWLAQPGPLVSLLSGLGGVPPRRSIAESPAWAAFAAQHPLLNAFVDSQAQARLPYFGPGAQDIAVLVAQAIEAAVLNQRSPKQALDDAARQADVVLARR